MNTGAKFYKCDFQVHTPRDLRFEAGAYITDEERERYSSNFIRSCREKGIDAVAITDHHDLTFFKYIKAASHDEVDEHGLPIPEDKRIVIFPGIELTLNIPCQAIVLFDSDIDMDDSLIYSIYGALGITQNKSSESRGLPPERLDYSSEVSEVYKRLNSIAALKNRYILLPNINHNGTFTILRRGNNVKYKKAKFLGGYLDESKYDIAIKDLGWLAKINGTDPEYGKRPIAIFQTSDCRGKNNFETLGESATWVKWSRPTAEGLKQACLASKSRISQELPKLPNSYIHSIKIIDSSFLETIEINFNQELNVLIGGRGTGKSSILQYINFALGNDNKIEPGFIDNTLGRSGKVQLELIVNNVKYTLKRTVLDHTLKIGESNDERTDYSLISSIFQFESFKQKELSSLNSTRGYQLVDILKYSIKKQLDELQNKLVNNEEAIKSDFVILEKTLNNLARLKDLKTQLNSKSEQVKSLRETITNLSEEDVATLDKKPIINKEISLVKNWNDAYNALYRSIESLSNLLNSELEEPDYELINNDTIIPIKDFILKKKGEIKTSIASILEKTEHEYYEGLKDALKQNIASFDHKYNSTVERQAKHRETLQKIATLTTDIQEIEKEIGTINSSLQDLQTLISKLISSYKERIFINEQIFKVLEKEAKRISSKGEGNIAIKVLKNDCLDHLIENVQNKTRNVRGTKENVADLFMRLKDTKKDIYKQIIKFWFCLYECKLDENKDLARLLDKYNISHNLTNTDINRVVESLSLYDIVEQSLQVPEPNIETKYFLNRKDSIPFSTASYGQQAGAILNLLLKQEIGTLLIDQPEDDLDNKVIFQITDSIISSKRNRQMIFATHNANIVVNGDAELVLCFEHVHEKTKGAITQSGSIDDAEVKKLIKNILEGGDKAFELRKEKYGF